jgi:hypothetical protein
MKVYKIAGIEKEAIGLPPRKMEFTLKIFYKKSGGFDPLHEGFDIGIAEMIMSKFPNSVFKRKSTRGLGINTGTIAFSEDEQAKVLDLVKQLRMRYPSKFEGGGTLRIGETQEDLDIADKIWE